MKDIKDYLHLYLGCECKIAYHEKTYFVRMVNETGLSVCIGTNKNGVPIWYKSNTCKPILRPLSDMTEEEEKEVGFDAYQMLRNEQGDKVIPSRYKGFIWAAKQTKYLLKQGFDLFGLIEAGLAIDITKLNKEK